MRWLPAWLSVASHAAHPCAHSHCCSPADKTSSTSPLLQQQQQQQAAAALSSPPLQVPALAPAQAPAPVGYMHRAQGHTDLLVLPLLGVQWCLRGVAWVGVLLQVAVCFRPVAAAVQLGFSVRLLVLREMVC